MTDNRQTATKVKGKLGRRKREESTFYKTVLEKASEFCWSSFAVERKTLPWSTRRNMIINKFTFGSPWLPDLLCKHWFTSSVWNFWGPDVPPGQRPRRRETRRNGCIRRLDFFYQTIGVYLQEGTYRAFGVLKQWNGGHVAVQNQPCGSKTLY